MITKCEFNTGDLRNLQISSNESQSITEPINSFDHSDNGLPNVSLDIGNYIGVKKNDSVENNCYSNPGFHPGAVSEGGAIGAIASPVSSNFKYKDKKKSKNLR